MSTDKGIYVLSDCKDNVNSPTHYSSGSVECIDYINQVLGDEGTISFCLANTIKYIHRHKLKGRRVEDLKKAKWYLDKVVSILDN